MDELEGLEIYDHSLKVCQRFTSNY